MRRSIPLAFSIAAVLGMNSLYADTIFCVHDQDLNDSQFCKSSSNFAEDTPSPPLVALGPLHKDCDIEALDVVYDPGDIYAASGDNTPRKGRLYRLDRDTRLDDLGGVYYTDANNNKIKLEEIDALSADPDDGVLWGWSQEQGLFKIMAPSNLPPPPDQTYDPLLIPVVNPNVGDCTTEDSANDFVVEAEMVIKTNDPTEIEDIEWNEDGEVLYGVENVHTHSDVDDHAPVDYEKGVRLWGYFPNVGSPPGTITQVCTNLDLSIELPVKGEVEGLDSLPRSFFDQALGKDILLLTYHGETTIPYVVITTPAPGDPPSKCDILSVGELTNNPFNDIEGIAYGPTVSF